MKDKTEFIGHYVVINGHTMGYVHTLTSVDVLQALQSKGAVFNLWPGPMPINDSDKVRFASVETFRICIPKSYAVKG